MERLRFPIKYPKWDFVAKFDCAGPEKVWRLLEHVCAEEGWASPNVLIKRSKDMWVCMLRCRQGKHPRIAFFSSTSVSHACFKAERALLDGSIQWRSDKYGK